MPVLDGVYTRRIGADIGHHTAGGRLASGAGFGKVGIKLVISQVFDYSIIEGK